LLRHSAVADPITPSPGTSGVNRQAADHRLRSNHLGDVTGQRTDHDKEAAKDINHIFIEEGHLIDEALKNLTLGARE